MRFGEDRLLLVDCLLLLTKLKDEEWCVQLVKHGMPKLLIEIMCKYHAHSILHLQIYKLFECVLSAKNTGWLRGVRASPMNSLLSTATWPKTYSSTTTRAKTGFALLLKEPSFASSTPSS